MGADLDSWIAKVRACEYLPENDLKQLCQMVSVYFRPALRSAVRADRSPQPGEPVRSSQCGLGTAIRNILHGGCTAAVDAVIKHHLMLRSVT